ncbi:MAG: tetratricopeptide repeat protein [Acidobacteria bacterium]|nr:tetratricopeptide repeat protein [Acidobacteriota bacterium]
MRFGPIGVVRVLVSAALVVGLAAGVAFGQQQGRIAGFVEDDDGNPMEGVSIHAATPGWPRTFEDVTRADGSFAFIGLTSDEWTFTAVCEDACVDSHTDKIDDTAIGYEQAVTPWRITQGRNPPIRMTMISIRHPFEIALGETALEGLDPQALEAEMNRADEAFADGRFDEAIAGYESLLGQLPTFHMLHVQIGETLVRKGDYQAAIDAFERALAEDSENQEAQAGIARAKLSMGDFDGASAELEAAAGSLNATKEDLYNLGELEFAKGAVDVAAGWYERAAAIDPNWEKPLFKLALVALNKGDIPGAKEYFQRVVDVGPNSPEGAQAQATLNALP